MAKKRGLGAIVVPAGPNLVTTWRNIVTQGGEIPLVEGLDRMNSDLGTKYLHHRVTEWEQALNGRKPSQNVINYMLEIVLPHLLEEVKVSQKDAKRIVDLVRIADTPLG